MWIPLQVIFEEKPCHCDRRCAGGAGRASYHMKGNIYRACVQSVFAYGTETWAMKARNLHSLERREQSL